ncbi:MAG: hypothetical protein R3249_00695 [Nitriliruptorales bacterium]|nr:hypothetical protein [Nitriliruptorales bacterium]
MSRTPRSIVALAAVALVLPALYGFGLPVSVEVTTATPNWASPDEATIHPGVQVVTAGAQCTTNFVFTNGNDVLIGMAAHCAGLGGQSDTNGCTTPSRPIGTPVSIEGARHSGTLVYSSWLAMQQAGTSGSPCQYNDFALVKIHPEDVENVNPSVPSWGGPEALGGATSGGESVYSHGDSGLRFGLLSPKAGISLGMLGGGWAHQVYTVTPGIPGDSGSGLLNSQGNAVGVLSTIALAPLTGSNNFSDLARARAFARSHGMGQLELVPGDVPFNSSLLGLLG